MPDIEYALVDEDDAGDVPENERCIWPGCTRRRAPGRTGGSGRQKEYCLRADRPETGAGPVHNARNRWAWRRRDAAGSGADVGEPADSAQSPGIVQEKWPVSAAKQRAGELLEQARRQHSAALSAFTAELDLYAQVTEQFRVMADPASRDLEITAISLKAGRDVSAAGEEVARAQRAQLTAEGERDDAMRRAAEADAAVEQLTEDTEAAEVAAAEAERHLAERTAEFERALAERTAGFERAQAELQQRTRAAETRAGEAEARATAARARAEEAIADAREQTARAREEAALAREEAASQVHAAEEEARQARQRADAVAAEARREVAAAHETAEQARHVADSARQDADRARHDAQARILAATAEAATANARAAAAGTETARLREELSRLRDERAAEVARLEAAHHSALASERARADRAEAELDSLRQA